MPDSTLSATGPRLIGGATAVRFNVHLGQILGDFAEGTEIELKVKKRLPGAGPGVGERYGCSGI